MRWYGFPKVHIHSLRHTHTSFLLTFGQEFGISTLDVSKQLGHANAHTTMTTYAHAVESRERLVSKTMDSILPLKERGAV
jgi:integrase